MLHAGCRCPDRHTAASRCRPPSPAVAGPHGRGGAALPHHTCRFYQHLEQGCEWAFGLVWGHAVSTDLVHWEHLPHAIIPDAGAPARLPASLPASHSADYVLTAPSMRACVSAHTARHCTRPVSRWCGCSVAAGHPQWAAYGATMGGLRRRDSSCGAAPAQRTRAHNPHAPGRCPSCRHRGRGRRLQRLRDHRHGWHAHHPIHRRAGGAGVPGRLRGSTHNTAPKHRRGGRQQHTSTGSRRSGGHAAAWHPRGSGGGHRARSGRAHPAPAVPCRRPAAQQRVGARAAAPQPGPGPALH